MGTHQLMQEWEMRKAKEPKPAFQMYGKTFCGGQIRDVPRVDGGSRTVYRPVMFDVLPSLVLRTVAIPSPNPHPGNPETPSTYL